MSASIVIVDDDAAMLRGLRGLLRPHADVRTAPHADAALALLEETPATIVMTDFQMPGRDGIELLGEVRARWPKTHRVLMSGHDQEIFVAHLRNELVEAFLKKPASRHEVASCLAIIGLIMR